MAPSARTAGCRRPATAVSCTVFVFGDPSLSLSEFFVPKIVPLAEIQRFVFEQLRHEPDVVIIGAQAVNAYLPPHKQRNTSDIDVQSTRPRETAKRLEQALRDRFHIAVRVGQTKRTTRIYQRATKDGGLKRFLVDVEEVAELSPHQELHGLRVVTPAELLAMKATSAAARGHRPEGLQDRADMMRLLERFPHLRASSEVPSRLKERAAPEAARNVWNELAASGKPHASPSALRKRYGHSLQAGARVLLFSTTSAPSRAARIHVVECPLVRAAERSRGKIRVDRTPDEETVADLKARGFPVKWCACTKRAPTQGTS